MNSNPVQTTDNIRSLLHNRLNGNRKGLAAYLMLGYPDYETSLEAMIIAAKEGADIIEIGSPFSDPIADGPVIQHAGNVAITNGVNITDVLDATREIRKRTKALPLVMTYANIIMQYGFQKFTKDATQAGLRGIILPDVPPQFFPKELVPLGPIYLASPLTTPKRLKELIKLTHGFLYIVSNLGITGEQRDYDNRLSKIVELASQLNPMIPKLLGFGVHDNKSARAALSYGVDGVVVGSALIRALGDKGDLSRYTDLIRDIVVGLGN